MSVRTYQFGRILLDSRQVFYESALSYASVNLKPIVRGHVLVLPKRCIQRFLDLSQDEVADLWKTVHVVSKQMQMWTQADAFTFAIQDGVAAGQTVPHVHVHIVPRLAHDFKDNDEVYAALEQGSQASPMPIEPDAQRKPRSSEEMQNEADELRKLFKCAATSSSL